MELRIVKRAVKAALLHQFVVVTLLGDLSVLQHEDQVGILNGGKPVRNDKAGSATHQFSHRLLNLHFGARVNVLGCLVKYQHGLIRQHGARNGDQLFLSLGNVHAVVR